MTAPTWVPLHLPFPPQSDIEAQLHRSLGIDKVIWLGKGVVGDTDTNGTVQLACNVCAPQWPCSR